MQNKQLQRDLKTILQTLKINQLQNIRQFFQSQTGIPIKSEYSRRGKNLVSCLIQYDIFDASGFGRSEEESFVNSIKNLLQTFVTNNYEIELLKNSLKVCQKEKNTQISRKSENLQTECTSKYGKNKIKQKNTNEAQQKKNQKHQQTIDLGNLQCDLQDIIEMSNILESQDVNPSKDNIKPSEKCQNQQSKGQKQVGCSCVYFDIHQHHVTEIKNLQARMKLISKENEMLKQLLLKDFKNQSLFHKKNGKKQRDEPNQSEKENSFVNSNTFVNQNRKQ